MNRLTLVVVLAAACSSSESEPGFEPKRRLVVSAEPRSSRAGNPLPQRVMRRYKPLTAPAAAVNPALVALGRMLYFEPRLSSTGEVSCNSCHPLDGYGVTHDATSKGVRGQTGTRNAPSTYNAARHFRQFWDGRSATIEDQAGDPILNPIEMGMQSSDSVVRALEAIRGYGPAFAAAFPGELEPITWAHVKEAIGAFERGLVTPGRWDRFLRGDSAALTTVEKEGARSFANLGCVVCHAGELAGGSMYEKLGAVKAWPNQNDKGRFDVTHDDGDEMMFKVSSLRNVAKTAPYFHDGSAATLSEAVRMMARHQLGEELDDDEVKGIVAWLEALSGEVPQDYIVKPQLPEAR
ncbi:MAG: c-type cytochrome [Myxococcaceae bacterium]|nr:c-type cytochrome [Myxococcaceae bacterium]